MKTVFVHRGGPDFASYRYRAQIPAENLNHNIDASVNSGDADVVVFAKPMYTDTELFNRCKDEGTPVVVDICDDHFDHKEIGPLYLSFIEHADQVTCSSQYLADRIHILSGKESTVIADPYEVERQEPHVSGNRVLWYGHQRNVTEIMPYVEKIDELAVVTGPNNILTGYTQWTPDNLRDELAYNDIVLLPGKEEYKSANRLINAIMAGCFVVAERTEVRKEFRKFAWIGPVMTGLQFAKENNKMLNELVLAGQEYIIKNYSPEVIGGKWSEVLEAA